MQTNKYNFACKIELKAMMVDNIANHNNMNYSSVESQTNKYDNDYIWLQWKYGFWLSIWTKTRYV